MKKSSYQLRKERLLKILELNRAGMNISDILPLLNVSESHYRYLKYTMKRTIPKKYLKSVNVMNDEDVRRGMEEIRKSGMTVSDYCRNNGLNIKSFFSRYYSRCVGDAPVKRNMSEYVVSEIEWSDPASYGQIKSRIEIPDCLIRK